MDRLLNLQSLYVPSLGLAGDVVTSPSLCLLSINITLKSQSPVYQPLTNCTLPAVLKLFPESCRTSTYKKGVGSRKMTVFAWFQQHGPKYEGENFLCSWGPAARTYVTDRIHHWLNVQQTNIFFIQMFGSSGNTFRSAVSVFWETSGYLFFRFFNTWEAQAVVRVKGGMLGGIQNTSQRYSFIIKYNFIQACPVTL